MTSYRPLTPKQEERRRKILAATRDMVADHGYDGMVMSEVAKKAGVSVTTLYNLYNTKDQLLLESLRHLAIDDARKEAAQPQGPGWQYLMQLVNHGATMATARPAYAEAILVALQRAKAGDELVRILIEWGRDDIRASLDAMQARQELKLEVDTQELATSFIGVYYSSLIMWNKGILKLPRLKSAMLKNCLSILIPATRGKTQKTLAALLTDLG